MADILSTGVSGLLAFQRGLDTTSHNIANVSTPGYSRQTVQLQAREPEPYGSGWVGRGVDVASIRRNYNDVLALQVRNSSSAFSQLDSFATDAESISNLFSDSSTGLSATLQNFTNSVQGVANAPTSLASRQVLLSQAQSLVDRLKSYTGQLDQMNAGINANLENEVNAINSDASAIANLNTQIAAGLSQTGQPPNDLLDKRDTLLNDLSSHVGVNVVSQTDGTVSVFIGTGEPLVLSGTAAKLTTQRDGYNSSELGISFTNPAGNVDVSSNLTGGTIGGLLQVRSQMLDPAINQLGKIAAIVVQTVNAQHQSGTDLNGNPGQPLFSIGGPVVLPATTNAVGGSLTVTTTNAAQLTGEDYVLEYKSGAWSLRDSNSGASVALAGAGTLASPFTANGLSIVVNGTPTANDHYLIRPTAASVQGMGVLISDPNAVAAASPVRASAGTANSGGASIASLKVTSSTNPALQTPATIQFTSATTYTINGGGSNTYTPGSPITANGWSLSLTGTPATGDQFSVGSNANGSGDNSNALAIANSLSSANSQIGAFVGQIGVQTSQAQSGRDAQSSIHDENVSALDSVSGVNLDEEAANMLQYQQAYQAAAQVIRVTQTMFQSLLDATRS